MIDKPRYRNGKKRKRGPKERQERRVAGLTRRPGNVEHQPTPQLRKRIKGMSIAGISRTRICEVFNMDIGTLKKHYSEETDASLEHLLAIASEGLHKALTKGQAWAICFTLKTRGKAFGWTERTEVTGKDGDKLFDMDMSKLTDAELEAVAQVGSILARVSGQSGAGATGQGGGGQPNAGTV